MTVNRKEVVLSEETNALVEYTLDNLSILVNSGQCPDHPSVLYLDHLAELVKKGIFRPASEPQLMLDHARLDDFR